MGRRSKTVGGGGGGGDDDEDGAGDEHVAVEMKKIWMMNKNESIVL